MNRQYLIEEIGRLGNVLDQLDLDMHRYENRLTPATWNALTDARKKVANHISEMRSELFDGIPRAEEVSGSD